jgi:hypothetical protein
MLGVENVGNKYERESLGNSVLDEVIHGAEFFLENLTIS